MSWDYLEDDDGYTQRAFIKGETRLHGELRLIFRPTTSIERVANQKAIRGMDLEAGEKEACNRAAKKIVAWTLKTRKGQEVPISGDSLARLHPGLYSRVMNIVYHAIDGGDEDSVEGTKHDPLPSGEQLAKNG